MTIRNSLATSLTLAFVAFIVVATLLATAPVFAHARYKSSTPGTGEVITASPARVDVTFTESIQKVSGTYDIEVNRDRGASVTAGPAVVDDADRHNLSVPLQPNLEPGRYVVNWKNTSDDDGDPVSGGFSFYLNAQPNAVDLENDRQLAQIGFEEVTATAAASGATPGAETPVSTPDAATAGPTRPVATSSAIISPGTPIASSGNADDSGGSAIYLIVGLVVLGAAGGFVRVAHPVSQGSMSLKRTAALAIAVLLAAIMFAGPARPVFAHAALVRANPANNETLKRPPVRIILNFSEPIERKLTQIQVTDRDGKTRFDEGATAFDDDDPAFASVGVKTLEPGLYFVRWSNVSSVDGHNLKGTYPFIVLNADGTFPAGVSLDNPSETTSGQLLPNNIDVALKWIALLALATIAGAAFFLLAVLRPAAKFLEDEPYQAALDAGERWLVNLAHLLLPLAFIASAFLVLRTVSRFETDTSLWSYLTTVRTGEYRGVQLICVALALAGGDLLFLGNTERRRNIGLAILLAATVAALFAYPLISHAATGPGKFWSTASDFVHLLASSTWLGALVMLPLLMRWRRRALDTDEGFLYLANAFDRFSVVAGISVIVVLATGTFNGLAEVPTADAMIDTTYGKVLLAKLILLAPLLAVAGFNAFFLKPRLVEVIDGLYQQGGGGTEQQRDHWSRRLAAVQRALPITIAVEIVLVVAVFAAVGVLSQTATAKGEIAQEKALAAVAKKFNQTATSGDLSITLEVSPNRVGLNDYNLSVRTADGKPSTTVTFARLRFTYDDVAGAVSPSEIILNKSGDGEYRGAGAYFTQPGNWRTEATIRRSDGDDVSGLFVLPVARAQASSSGESPSPYELPFTVFNWNEVAGAVLALGGAVIILYRKQLRWLQQPGYRASITLATVLLLSGAVLALGVDTHNNVTNATAGNPVKSTPESVERGRTLFQQNCIVCHGIDGRGDGPEAANLSPAPTDFRLHTPLHTDPQFYAFIADGYPGSAMPKFREAFSETDIWNLVNYLRNAFTEELTE